MFLLQGGGTSLEDFLKALSRRCSMSTEKVQLSCCKEIVPKIGIKMASCIAIVHLEELRSVKTFG